MNLLGRRPPGHRRGKAAPDAVEDPDDLRGAAIGGQVDRAPRIPLLTEHAVGHGEPAVVDAFDGPTGFACADAEMADRLARVKNHTRSGFQCTPARQNVACRDVVSQHNRLVVGDQLVRGHGPLTSAAATVVVVGAGLTGIETACELPGRLHALFARGDGVTPRVVLIDHNPFVGSDMGLSARPVIEQALLDNGVETRTGVSVAAVSPGGVTLSSGERLAAATVVWCAGMRASRLTEQLPVARDRLGRLQVDDYLRVIGVPAMFAAGDVAAARMDDEHLSVMSCQHGRPMGRYAGCNVINDLFDQPLLALRIPWYVTVLDLGSAGAVYTEGWERKVVSQGAPAKTTKQSINTRRIYPPLNGSRADLLAAAAPRVQPRP